MKNLAVILTIALTAACGGDDGSDPAPGEDLTAPTVVSMSPEDGAVGVRDDAAVVIEFSEPMDRLSVQDNIDAADLGAINAEWNDDSTVLTITPDQALAYAEGEGLDPSLIPALSYVVEVGAGAADEAGNGMAGAVQTSFSTLKRMTGTLDRDNGYTGAGTSDGVTTDDDDFLYVGDDDAQELSKAYRGYISIDLLALPIGVEIESALLLATQMAEINAPYAALSNGDGLLIDHGTFKLGSPDDDKSAFEMAPLSNVGVLAQSGDIELELDVTAEVRHDVANRAQRSQYRLRFDSYSNLDDSNNYVLIGRDDLGLEVVYLAP